jgi:hypothetical protein
MTGRESHAVKLLPIDDPATDKALENIMGRQTTDQQVIDALRKATKKAAEPLPEFCWVLKSGNPYKDASGLFTTKERAVAPGWYKSHGGHHVEVGEKGKIVSGSHAGKVAESQRMPRQRLTAQRL